MLLYSRLQKISCFSTNNFEMEFLILDYCVKGRFCAQFGQKSLASSSFDDRFKMHSICFAPFWLLLPFSTAHRQIRTFFFHSKFFFSRLIPFENQKWQGIWNWNLSIPNTYTISTVLNLLFNRISTLIESADCNEIMKLKFANF